MLTYHRVDETDAEPRLYPTLLSATPQDFEDQMKSVLAHFRPIALPELVAAYRGELVLPRRAILVTFDDAYRDFRDNAWPILRRLAIPVTLFVPTAYPGRSDLAFWWDRVWAAVTQAADEVRLDPPVGRLSFAKPADRPKVARALINHYKQLPHEEAMREVDKLSSQLGAEAAESHVLDWEDIHRLSIDGVHVASHSTTHSLLTRIPRSEVATEAGMSRRDLERHLPGAGYGSVFAYPGGEHDAPSRSVLRELGYELAFTTSPGLNRVRRTDPLRLLRFNVGRRTTPELMRAQIALSAVGRQIAGIARIRSPQTR